MTEFPTAAAIADRALQAAFNAAKQYQKMSGGQTVHNHAIETFVSSKIAEAVYDLTSASGGTVGLEVPFGEVHALSEASRIGRVSSMLSKNFRFDAVVLKQGRPFGLIEVKKRFAASAGQKDVIRLSEAIWKYGPQNKGSVNFGLWVALQRIGEGSRRAGEDQSQKFIDSFDWAVKPTIVHQDLTGSFGSFKRSGKSIGALRVFGVLFEGGGPEPQ